MKLLVDMNLSPRWVSLLKESGFQAAHWSTIGQPTTPDAENIAFAALHDYVILTHDLDFGAILAATQGLKPSVVQIRSADVSLDAIGKQVVSALLQVAQELESGALLTIDLNRSRLRLLPLSSKE